MKRTIIILIILYHQFSFLFAQSDYTWSTTGDGIFRDGIPFFLNGQSWSKKTEFTYNKGISAESTVKKALGELHEIGVNAIRLYGSPDENDWNASSNYKNLIKWIEEWNAAHPDGGDPNKAMYYFVQLSPKDPESTISGDLPENSSASFNRAINDVSNSGSIRNLIKTIDEISLGSKYLIGYLLFHELNISSKYIDWFATIGAGGIESFMNDAADAIHNTYAHGKLVAHTGDAIDNVNGIYNSIEALDASPGNVFANFDMLGFNLYISTDALLEEDTYFSRIVNRRALSVNDKRGWFIGETGVSYDLNADPGSVAAANYANHEGGANLQIMLDKSRKLGNMMGFMMFTVQDNDTQETINLNAMKQRGHFDYYGDKKFLYYIYPDIVEQISSNERFHSTPSHNIGVKIEEDKSSYKIAFNLKNKTDTDKEFFYTIHSDDGTSKQRFAIEKETESLTIGGGVDTTIFRIITRPEVTDLIAVSINVIKEYSPLNPYLWSREYILDDAICTVAGLNLNTDNLPGKETNISIVREEEDFKTQGVIILKENQVLKIPDGEWHLNIYNLNGSLLYNKQVSSNEKVELDNCISNNMRGIAFYTLRKI